MGKLVDCSKILMKFPSSKINEHNLKKLRQHFRVFQNLNSFPFSPSYAIFTSLHGLFSLPFYKYKILLEFLWLLFVFEHLEIMLKMDSESHNGNNNKLMTSRYLIPRVWLDLWKFKFCVVWIHFLYLLSCGCSQNFDDLNQLVHSTISREDWLA